MGIFTELVDDFKHMPPAGKFAVVIGGGAVVAFFATRVASGGGLSSGSTPSEPASVPTVGTGSSGGLDPNLFTPPDAISGGGFDPGGVYSPPPVVPSSDAEPALRGNLVETLSRKAVQSLLGPTSSEAAGRKATAPPAPSPAPTVSLQSVTGGGARRTIGPIAS